MPKKDFSKRVICLIGMLASITAMAAAAKRTAPPEPPHVDAGDISYCLDYKRDLSTSFKAFLMARRIADKKIVWQTPLYEIKYNKAKETDVQERFISQLTVAVREGKTVILATDEVGDQYSIDAKSGKIFGKKVQNE